MWMMARPSINRVFFCNVERDGSSSMVATPIQQGKLYRPQLQLPHFAVETEMALWGNHWMPWFLNFQRSCSWKERNHMRVSWNGGTPIAEWFVRETPPKMDDNQGYPYFRTPSYIEPSLWHQLSRESQDHIVSTWKAGVAVQRWRAWCRCNFRMGKPSWMIGMRSWCFQILYV